MVSQTDPIGYRGVAYVIPCTREDFAACDMQGWVAFAVYRP
jgi:hypothetical protein